MVDADVSTVNTTIGADKVKQPWYMRILQAKASLLTVICLAQLLDTVNIASVTIALPSIANDVGYKPAELQWVISSYALTFCATLLVGGRLGDLFGHRRIFLLGTSWFALWSLVCGFARNPVFMSVARAIQGSGAGFTIPSALALLTTTYPLGPERSFALSMFGGASCLGQTIGVLLGGIFDATIGWYWVFFVTAAISAVLSFLGFFIISKTYDNPNNTDRRIDYLGVFLFIGGIVCVVYYLSESNTMGWGSAKTLAPFLVGLALLAAFVFLELRIDYPIMPFHIWRSRRFFSSVIVIICVTSTYNSMIFYTSLTFQNVLGFNSIITACCYIVHGVGLVVGLYTVSRLYKYVRTKIIMCIGWVLIVASSVIFAHIAPNSTYWQFAFPALIVNCIGLSPTWMSCQVNAVADAKDEDQGVVGAIFNVAVQLGGPIGLALSTILAQSQTPAGATGGALMKGYSAAFYTFGVIGGVGLVLTLIFASNHDPVEFSGVVPEKAATMVDNNYELSMDVEAIGDKAEVSEVKGQASSSLSLSSSSAPTVNGNEKK
ncbi:hypothetical protein BG004_002231 [Podila humilis]|nr:hypothetical protein BG004_002231 [Podila humilis]